MKIEKIKLSSLKHPELNVRMHTDKQLCEFRRSVEMFGQIRPIVVDENNTIIAGNGLYETLVSLNYSDADCYVVTGLSETEKKKLMLADNKIFDLGVDDMTAFDKLIAELGDDLDVPGYDEDLLQALVSDVSKVDEMMSDYGIVDVERRETISAAHVDERVPMRPTEAAVTPTNTAVNAPEETYRSEPTTENAAVQPLDPPHNNYVVCPKCGERIWL